MSSLDSARSIEINNCLFCANHRLEVCRECDIDEREGNDGTFGFDPIDRGTLALPTLSTNKDGVLQCKKHSNPECNLCFGWKKQLTKLHAAAKKAK
ncbi:hypothetical protein CTheo_7175 [Ceratobasidium theobromae]|uniref:Uncharacterized protein n=1 Tax=Ceratobasidium theobromae TaxID=1582974 RepID=A0A5N5QDH0_9AGAM|nr:hypothetical protein CTheo_7175 [Ceratobasidium theobromae]